MPGQNIRDVLNRRNDLSTFVVHLTKATASSPKQNLESIISEGKLRAGSAMGWADEQDDPSDPARQSQRVVSFSETPLEHIYSLVADISGRQIELQPYGLAFTKMAARRIGINPVWYVDRTAGAPHQWRLSKALNELKQSAVAKGDFHSSATAKLLPFCQVMGTWPDHQVEFWWEREWRHPGDLAFTVDAVSLWLCPEAEIEDFTTHVLQQGATKKPQCIDPRWGLEQIVAHLVGETDVTPFDAH